MLNYKYSSLKLFIAFMLVFVLCSSHSLRAENVKLVHIGSGFISKPNLIGAIDAAALGSNDYEEFKTAGARALDYSSDLNDQSRPMVAWGDMKNTPSLHDTFTALSESSNRIDDASRWHHQVAAIKAAFYREAILYGGNTDLAEMWIEASVSAALIAELGGKPNAQVSKPIAPANDKISALFKDFDRMGDVSQWLQAAAIDTVPYGEGNYLAEMWTEASVSAALIAELGGKPRDVRKHVLPTKGSVAYRGEILR